MLLIRRLPTICRIEGNLSASSRTQVLLEQHTLQEVAIVFFDAQGKPIERVTLAVQVRETPLACRNLALQSEPRFAWSLSHPTLSPFSFHAQLASQHELQQVPPFDFSDLEASLTSALLVLSLSDSVSPALPPGETPSHHHHQQQQRAVILIDSTDHAPASHHSLLILLLPA